MQHKHHEVRWPQDGGSLQQHACVQVILRQLDAIEDQTLVKSLHKKMAPPLVTLLSAESEIQYVALRNINLIVQKSPQTLAHEVKVSTCLNKTGVCQHALRRMGWGDRASSRAVQLWTAETTRAEHMFLLQLPKTACAGNKSAW